MDNGTAWNFIADVMSDTSYDWLVPTPANNKKNCLVKVIGFDPSFTSQVAVDKSDAPFTIEVTRLTSPNGGDLVPSGGTWPITWTTNGTTTPVDSVKLTYTLDNGLTWKPIPAPTGNPGYPFVERPDG